MSLALLLTLDCNSKASPQSVQEKNKKLMAFRWGRWADPETGMTVWGWMFLSQCRRHLTHRTHLPLLQSPGRGADTPNVLQADVPKGSWLQCGSVPRGDSRAHSALHLHLSLTHCEVSKRSPKLSVLALSNPGKHLLLHAGEELNSRNIPSCKNIPKNAVFWFINATDWGRGDKNWVFLL